jgi:hypothetical protein
MKARATVAPLGAAGRVWGSTYVQFGGVERLDTIGLWDWSS